MLHRGQQLYATTARNVLAITEWRLPARSAGSDDVLDDSQPSDRADQAATSRDSMSPAVDVPRGSARLAPRALCALTSPGVNILASGMLFSGQRVSELRCERQVAYVLRRLGGSERSTELARSTSTAVSLTTHPPRPGRMV